MRQTAAALPVKRRQGQKIPLDERPEGSLNDGNLPTRHALKGC